MMIFAHFCIRGLNSKVAAILAASLEISWQPFYAPIGCTFFHSTWGGVEWRLANNEKWPRDVANNFSKKDNRRALHSSAERRKTRQMRISVEGRREREFQRVRPARPPGPRPRPCPKARLPRGCFQKMGSGSCITPPHLPAAHLERHTTREDERGSAGFLVARCPLPRPS